MPILETHTQHWLQEADCQACAKAIAGQWLAISPPPDAYLELHGDLGAGKTTLTRHLLQALGVRGRIKSPSYTVLESYAIEATDRESHAQHFDFYRFNDPHEWEDAGFRDAFAAPGLKIVEWPEKAAGFLPEPDLRIYLHMNEDASRSVRLEAASPLGQRLLKGQA